MADEREVVTIEIDRLFEFVDELQANGYRIDPRQIAALNHLLVTLIAGGEALDQLPLKIMIAPLVCSTPLEQEDFYQRFERWQATLLPVKQIDSEGELSFMPPPQEVDIPPTIEPAIPQETPYITREATKQEADYTKVLVKGYVQEILPVTQIKPIVSALRKRTQVPSTEVDVERTIEYAINHNNWMEIIYRQRQVLPEYVVLIDRKNRLDLQARFVQEVLSKLAADGVWLHQFEFKGDPRICFPLGKKNTPLRLKDLQARHPDSRLLVFSGTNELTNPLTGNLQEWIESLEYWKERALLTPDNLGKGLLEGMEEQDFAVLPLTFDGLASVVRVFEADNIPLSFSEKSLPAPLTERPTRWTGRTAPPETEVRALINEIKINYLGEGGFYWLCATAVYPELRWELTLHLGSVLKDGISKPLLEVNNLIHLARLPWFRLGYMPDWIRLPLIESLLPEQEMQVREVISNLLSSAQEGLGFELSIARIANGELQKQVLQDHVMIKFLASSEKKKIDITVPSSLQNIFSQNQSNTDQLDHSKSILDSSPESSSTNEKHGTLNEKAHNDLMNSTPSQIGYKHSFDLKPRVLIVDNDPTDRILYQSLLMEWGYDPVLAMRSGKTLIDNAKKLAKEKRCALALIDLRLVEDHDEQDVSGLRLAEEISNQLTPIIMSGYDDPNALRRLLQKSAGIIFISKKDRPDSIEEILNSEAAKVTATKRNLVFENVELLEEITSTLGQFTGEYTDQVADIFAHLFPRARKMRLEKLGSYSRLSTISTAPRPASVILKVYEDDYEPCVVKISRAVRIQREVENYYKYIDRRLTANFSPRMVSSSILWDIGAVTYSYIGEFDTRTFSQFYEGESVADIEECLSKFFREVWGGNYKQARDVHDTSLFNLYSAVWGNWYERIKGISDLDPSFLNSLNIQMDLPRPIEWFKNNITETLNDASFLKETRVAITHGDLHSDNLLVDSKNNPWVISYERCGEGHILQDFIELEADIINRLDAGDENLSNYIRLLTTVLKQKTIQGFDKSKISTNNARYEKAFQTISNLRSLALTCTDVTDAREYLLGLLFNMIFRASAQETNSPASQRALLCASIICHRLDHWNESWSLFDAQQYKNFNLNALKEDNKAIEKKLKDESAHTSNQQYSKMDSPAHPLGKERFLRVFIAHTSENKSDAKYLYDYLHKLDIAPWLDSEKIKGQNWNKEILKSLDETDVLLLCLSKKSVNKRGYLTSTIKGILDHALKEPEGSIIVIPVRLDDCEIPHVLQNYQSMDLFAENGIERLLESLSARAQQVMAKSINLDRLPAFELRKRKYAPREQTENKISNKTNREAKIKNSVLIVDNDQTYLELLKEFLETEFSVSTANNPEIALQIIQRQKPPFQVIITELRLSNGADERDQSGIALLRDIKALGVSTPTILLTSFPAVDSTRKDLGEYSAFDYVSKSAGMEKLREIIHRAAEQTTSEINEKLVYQKSQINTTKKSNLESVEFPVHGSASGKIILFGEHAVVYSRPALAVPVIKVRAEVKILTSPRPGIWIHAVDIGLHAELASLPSDHPIATVILNLFSTLNTPLPSALDITISSTIPVAAGLGSGAAVSIALIRALSSFVSQPFSDNEVNLLAFDIEKIHHGTPSGLDNTVISYNKPAYFIKGKPIETFKVKKPFTIVIGDTGIPSPTKESVGDVRRLWLSDTNKFENIFNEIGQITLMARRSIETGKTKILGELMDRNHVLLQQLTVSSPELDRLVVVAREAGAFGAKLSGGGRGGNMIALADTKNAKKIASALDKAGAINTVITTIEQTED